MFVKQNQKEGKVGDRRKDGKYTYEKGSRGAWGLVKNEALRKHLVELYVKKEMSLTQVSKETGIPYSVTQNLLNHFDLMRAHSKKTQTFESFMEKNFETTQQMYADGCTLLEISEQIKEKTGLDFSRDKFLKYFKAKGVHIRSSKEAHAKAMETGRKTNVKPAGVGLFKPQAIDSWHYHLDMDLSALTFEQYRRVVYRFTYMVTRRFPKMFPENISMASRKGVELDLDHQSSLFNGYYIFKGGKYVQRKQPVALDVICHPENLKLMCRMTNMQKHNQNHLQLDQLQNRVKKHQLKHGDIFDDYYGRYTKEDYVKLLAR